MPRASPISECLLEGGPLVVGEALDRRVVVARELLRSLEAMRVLKRHLSNVVYRRMMRDLTARLEGPTRAAEAA